METNASFSRHEVILFNCSCHSFKDVLEQLVKAIHCTPEEGLQYAAEVNAKGSSVVYVGPKERCEAVADVLGQVGLIAVAS